MYEKERKFSLGLHVNMFPCATSEYCDHQIKQKNPKTLNNTHTTTQQLTNIIIQHMDTLPKYGQKLSMDVGPHDVFPTIDVNFSILTRECKNKKLVDNIFSSNFVLLSMC